ncbi:type I-E CRISPR-associated protein Cas5/CasD [Streptomyces sp. NPDC127108]|uniref:type I-E CRISPR-associated protein Cas5/CasD n=1 Tax=Streptomyces sp. NPDC127108 TaxID=3345361 RepID=UPI0036322807
MNSPRTPDPHAETGLLLRLTGPLQSWGERSPFNERDTALFPTRSGVIGLLASALGRSRDQPPDDLARLSLTIRVDRPGVPLRDLHTVGGGLPAKATVTTAEGKKRSGDTGTLLTHRTYLADAAFTVAVTGGPADAELLNRAGQALIAPRWPLFLGRRSCPPEGPLLLGATTDPLRHLVHLPLAAPRPREGFQDVAFLSDQPLNHRLTAPEPEPEANEDQDGAEPTSEITDQPLSFRPGHRAHGTRDLYQRALRLPADQHTGLGVRHLTALATYVAEHFDRPALEGGRP